MLRAPTSLGAALIALCLTAAAGAQTPATQAPYEPKVGQQGKDVVWVPTPQALVDKIKQSRTFNQGNALGQAVTAARMDLDWHSLPADAPLQAVHQVEAAALASAGAGF